MLSCARRRNRIKYYRSHRKIEHWQKNLRVLSIFAMRICHQVVKPNRKTENMRQKTPGIEHGVGVSTGLSGHNLFFLNCCTRRFSLSESALCTAGYFLRNLANVSRESPNRLHMSVIDLSCSSMRTISS